MSTLVIGIISSLIAAIIFGIFVFFVRSWRSNRGKTVFVSAPMASLLTDSEYNELREAVRVFVQKLRKKGYSVFSAIEEIESESQFDSADVKSEKMFLEIKKNSVFALIYFSKIPSGSLAETGYALARNKRCFFIYKKSDVGDDSSILPWNLESLEKNPGTSKAIVRCGFNSISEFKKGADAAADKLG